MKFVTDAMLGKLAKWLRLLGYDVFYDPNADDAELASIAERDGRILLTRDTQLARHHKVKDWLLIQSCDWQDQLVQTALHFNLDVESNALTRCLDCNEVLEETAKEQVRYEVPSFVYRTQEHFYRCPSCQKVYWAGTHYQNASKTLADIQNRVRAAKAKAKAKASKAGG